MYITYVYTTMCPPSYHHNGFMVTPAHLCIYMHIYAHMYMCICVYISFQPT